MALTPQNNDAFFREVDEQLRRDQAARLFKRWGVVAIAGIVLALAALGGWLWWQSHRTSVAGVEGEKLSGALADLTEGKPTAAKTAFTSLADSSVEGHRAAAKLALADMKLSDGNVKGAAADFAAIAADTRLAQPYRDLALVREVSLRFDELPPAQVITRLKPLAVAGNPWFGSAGELVAIAHLKMNNTKAAGNVLLAMSKDRTLPESIRTRTAQLAGGIGVDVEPAKPSTGS